MLSNDRTRIILMNPVRIDFKLSKHQKDGSAGKNAVASSSSSIAWGGNDIKADGNDGFWMTGLNNENMWDGVPFSVQRRFKTKAARTVVDSYIKFRLLFDKPKKDPVDIFSEIKDNFMALDKSDLSTIDMIELLKQLERAKQYQAVKTAKEKKNISELEEKLVKAKLIQYQTEKSLIKFILQSKKGLCLTEIENFDRVIPSEVIDKIEAAETLKVFDNYYILHYDPTGAENIFKKLTDKPEPKDPIVFGVISGSDKLYYIADWIDKYCNLTYKELLKESCDMKLEIKPAKK